MPLMIPVNRQQGFSLLEILVAFAILALSIGVLLKIFSGGVNSAVIAEDYNAAVQIAQSIMAKTGVETQLLEGEESGWENDKYHWQVITKPFQFNPDNFVDIDLNTLKTNFFKVDVIVSWGDDGRELQLSTLKLVHKPTL